MRWKTTLHLTLFATSAVLFFIVNSFFLGLACLIPACLISLGIPTKHAPHSEYYKEKENNAQD